MKKLLILLFTSHLVFSQQNSEIKVGSEKMNEYLDKISNKSVGLLVNHSSTVRSTHLIDTLISKNINIKKYLVLNTGLLVKLREEKLLMKTL
jgi:uncharacterized protein YbbC (DUF1343 family)